MIEDKTLVLKSQQGDHSAFGQLVMRYSKRCFGLAIRICKQRELAEDIVQESMILAFEHIRQFKNEAKYSTWLYRIVYNQSIKALRGQKFWEDIDTQSNDPAYDSADTEWVDANENALKLALDKLKDNERLVVDLFYYQEQSIESISSITSLSISNVKVLLFRTRKKLADMISNELNLQQK